MNLVTCPNCKTRVLPKANGNCPSCGYKITKSVIRTPETFSPASTQKQRKNIFDEEKMPTVTNATETNATEKLYLEYLREAKRIAAEVKGKVLLPGLIVMVLMVIGCISFYVGLSKPLGYGTRNLMGNLFWWCIIGGIVITIIGKMRANGYGKEEANRVGRTKPGFDTFFQIHQKSYGREWPDHMPSGEKYKKFLAITKTKKDER